MRKLNAFAILLVVGGVRAQDSGAQAVCQPSFDWMNNANHLSPCLIAGSLQSMCSVTHNTVPPLDGSNHYVTGALTNQCSCSWAVYNLLSGCTACQGFSNSILTWPAYSANCTQDLLSSTFFPTKFSIPDGAKVPFWAGQDPTTWPDQRFSDIAAHQLANEHRPDLASSDVNSNASKKASSQAGPIAGGVIGGLVGLMLLIGLAFFIYKRSSKSTSRTLEEGSPKGHAHKPSEVSQKSDTSFGFGYGGFWQRSPSPGSFSATQAPTSPTLRTHNGSVPSFSYFGSANGSVRIGSPPPAEASQESSSARPHTVNQENLIVPFTLQHSTAPGAPQPQGDSPSSGDRKRADGAIIPLFDPPTLPPQIPRNAMHTTESAPSFNPPAYSRFAAEEDERATQNASPIQVISRARTPHSRQDSGDTTSSWDSTTRTGMTRTANGDTSVPPAIEDIMSRAGYDYGQHGQTHDRVGPAI